MKKALCKDVFIPGHLNNKMKNKVTGVLREDTEESAMINWSIHPRHGLRACNKY